MCSKVLAEGKKPWRYFFDYWNVFDFLVVVAGFIPFAGGGAVMVGSAMPPCANPCQPLQHKYVCMDETDTPAHS